MFRCICVLLPLCLILAVGTARSGDKKEQEKLEGTWTVVKLEGGSSAKEKDKEMKLTFKGDTVTMMAGDKKQESKYVVDPTKKPKTMDVHVEKDGQKQTILLIYELDGDNMQACHWEGKAASESRPKEFAAGKDSVLVKLKRDRK